MAFYSPITISADLKNAADIERASFLDVRWDYTHIPEPFFALAPRFYGAFILKEATWRIRRTGSPGLVTTNQIRRFRL